MSEVRFNKCDGCGERLEDDAPLVLSVLTPTEPGELSDTVRIPSVWSRMLGHDEDDGPHYYSGRGRTRRDFELCSSRCLATVAMCGEALEEREGASA